MFIAKPKTPYNPLKFFPSSLSLSASPPFASPQQSLFVLPTALCSLSSCALRSSSLSASAPSLPLLLKFSSLVTTLVRCQLYLTLTTILELIIHYLACATPCLTNPNLHGCAITDFTCLCTNTAFLNESSQCIYDNCTNPKDLKQATDTANGVCEAAVRWNFYSVDRMTLFGWLILRFSIIYPGCYYHFDLHSHSEQVPERLFDVSIFFSYSLCSLFDTDICCSLSNLSVLPSLRP